MSDAFDSIVIGAGHNGLVCAAMLAKAGQQVLVLEATNRVGGASITREFAPGHRVSACAHLLSMMPKAIMDDLDLASHGLVFAATNLPTTALSMQDSHLTLLGRKATGFAASDASAYDAFITRMRRFARHLAPILDSVPPRLGTSAWNDRLGLLRAAWHVRSLGRTDIRELLRIIGMNVFDMVEDHFESPLLRGAVAFDALLGTNFGPRSPGSMLTLLTRFTLEAAAGNSGTCLPAGGMGAVAEALAGAAQAAGATLRTGARVARILVKNDCAAGVILDNGEIFTAKTVISNVDPRRSFLRLLGTEHLDTGFVRRIDHFRSKGLTAKLHLALSGPPPFRGLDAKGLKGRLLVAPSPEYLEKAYNYTKYGEYSRAPALEISVPTASDPSLAPPGRHILSIIAQYAPTTPAGDPEADRNAFIERIIDTIEIYAPGVRSLITATELLTPSDIEQEFGISGGHWHHGELAFDQFFMVRPVPGAAQHRTPLPGLFLCGAGCHPGGGVMGIAGRNAAREVLRS